MAVKCQRVMQLMETLAPKKLAEEWDNVGLLLGDPRADVHRLMISLDVNREVAAEADERQVNLLVTHHPLIFRPLKHLRFDLPEGALIRHLIGHQVMVYSAHTNLDSASDGVNACLARSLGLQQAEILQVSRQEQLFKLVVFVPQGHEGAVRDALGDAGAGWIGNYSHCTFRTPGTGTFLPREGTNPFIGARGQLEEVEELRLETIVPERLLDRAVKAMIRVHPYEEVAYDIYPLSNQGTPYGLGRIGLLPEAVPLDAFIARVKEALGVSTVKVAGGENRPVRKIAVCGGAGATLIHQASFRGADVLVTGDVKYHEAQEAVALGLAVIDAGHYATEAVVIPALAAYLEDAFQQAGEDVEVLVSRVVSEPWQYL